MKKNLFFVEIVNITSHIGDFSHNNDREWGGGGLQNSVFRKLPGYTKYIWIKGLREVLLVRY